MGVKAAADRAVAPRLILGRRDDGSRLVGVHDHRRHDSHPATVQHRISIHSCFPVGTPSQRHAAGVGDQPCRTSSAAVWMSVCVCSMSTVSQGNPEPSHEHRAAATHCPGKAMCRSAVCPLAAPRMTGFFFNVAPWFQSGSQRYSPGPSQGLRRARGAALLLRKLS